MNAPLYRDPIYDGCSDPTVIYNPFEKAWWMFYTQRRANLAVGGVAHTFGTKIGIASSMDGGETWVYRGVCEGLVIDRGENTFWAPEVFFDPQAQLYRMLVTYHQGVHMKWGIRNMRQGIAHFTSTNLWDWTYAGFIREGERDYIDACVFPLPQGGWRVWYRDTKDHCATHFIDTEDFSSFTEPRLAAEGPAEGPNVFALGGYYWLITDPLGFRQGLAVYRSEDLEHWTRMPNLLDQDGHRPMDQSPGRHADVLSCKDHAYIFYFTQPFRDYAMESGIEHTSGKEAICIAQCALIRCKDGRLQLDRDEAFTIDLNVSLS